MLHLVRFAAGLATGIFAMTLIQNKSTKDTLKKAGRATKETVEKAQDKLRGATVTSLEAIESASAKARTQLTQEKDAVKTEPKKITPRQHASKHDHDQEKSS